MKIAVLKETRFGENRVAATPDTVRRFIALGADVCVEESAGEASFITDAAYIDAGAEIEKSPRKCLEGANIVLAVNAPDVATLAHIEKGAALVGMLSPNDRIQDMAAYAAAGIDAFAPELLPRISRAQAMDVLSSQSNLAGYRAVIEGVAALAKATPMMMTAAGTVRPAKVLILGAGVAGLQAIATAKRLGAVVSAFDVRPAVKEQVESLGATFVEVPADPAESAETKSGYANEMSEDYKRRQAELIAKTAAAQDIIITTALIPGRPAPILLDQTTVESMKPGSVIIDLAASGGGNCALTEKDSVVQHYGVTILGAANLPSQVAVDASALYARNLFNFVSTLLIKDKTLDIQWGDELIAGTCLSRGGELVHPMFRDKAIEIPPPVAKKKPTPRAQKAKEAAYDQPE